MAIPALATCNTFCQSPHLCPTW